MQLYRSAVMAGAVAAFFMGMGAVQQARAQASTAEPGLLAQILRAARPDLAEGQARLYDAQTLQPAALKRCLVLAHGIDRAAEALAGQRTRVLSLQADLDRLAGGRGRAHLTVEELKRANATRREYLVEAAQFEAGVNRRNQDVSAFNRDCGGKRYFAADLLAITPDLPFDPKEVR